MRKLNSTNFLNEQALAEHCGVTYAMTLLTGRWKINILWMLKIGVNRYGLMKREIAGISEKMLTQRLKELEDDGLIVKKDYKTVPPKVEYSLSEAGEILSPILGQLSDWGDKIRPILKENN
ncbi:helix-turn-helix transcriptional regulator [Flavobacterium alkalisoli]|uniref:Helix-turn-helix transcriptional regulator n=1 Tax=Flavobacterium alkalisoli TaxID=2602769 RepID=A0A5B9FNB5_9FLAO|nr:helix-turn-helix domain-containing protein [Flavobacterium alkalisoli]QEE48484.1 helix-turn-helix transcriptional regulator [Flavobacterium alkalisoli]